MPPCLKLKRRFFSMEMFVFAVFDRKSETFNTPFFMRTLGEALRAFQDLCEDDRTIMHRHPEDFSLVQLGKWDPRKGLFETSAGATTLAHADEFKRAAPTLAAVPTGVV